MNTFRLQNFELVQAVTEVGKPAVLIVVDDFTGYTKCTSTLELPTVGSTAGTITEKAYQIATGALKAGVAVYFASDLVPAKGNAIRTVINCGEDLEITNTMLSNYEADGIFRIVVAETAPTMTNWSEADKSRWVHVDFTTLVSNLDTNSKAQLVGYIAGTICAGYYEDSALPFNNVAVTSIIDSDCVIYKTSTELNTLFHGNKVAFYNVNDVPCIFGIPTLASYNSGNALWFDLTVRQIADYIADSVFVDLRAKYPRSKRNQDTLTSIKATVLARLESASQRGIVEDVEKYDVVVISDPDDNYGIIITYTVDVVTPLYTVTVKQNITLGDNTPLVG